jgi:putative nucleotidyltransferase with HDIG domain
MTITQNREGLETQEMMVLHKDSQIITREAGDQFMGVRRQLRQLGAGLQDVPPSLSASVRRDWVESHIASFLQLTGQDFATRVVDLRDDRQFGRASGPVQQAMDRAQSRVSASLRGDYELLNRGRDAPPLVVVSVPVLSGASQTELDYVVQAVVPLEHIELDGDVFILDATAGGEVIWSATTEAAPVMSAVRQTDLVQEYLEFPTGIKSAEYPMRIGSNTSTMIGQIGPLGDTGWALLVQKPKSSAFQYVRKLVSTTVWAAVFMVILALAFAGVAARLTGQPIQRLAETSQEIAAGDFGRRVQPSGLGSEIADLADSFNQMSGHVEEYVRRLREAVQVNRQLFIGSIRAFLAAIEAKEPYTRGHSERVATFSQAIARRLDLSRDVQEQIWIAGLLHDVGKIGIEDRVLNKGDVLTDEEYEIMKRHPVLGADIMSSIEQMREMLPAIRWHHEKWNGKGYPDGLAGEQIPLMARIVAVGDTFDAVTTQRVYQDPFTPEEALEIIKKLDGTGFDPHVVAAFLEAFNAGEIELAPSVTTTSRRQTAASLTEAAVHT